MPMKTCLYAALSGLLNEKSYEFGAEMVKIACEELQQGIQSGDLIRAKLSVSLAN